MSVDISVSITEDVVDIIATPTVNIVNVTNSASIDPGLYDLSEFTNTSPNPFVRSSGLSSYVPTSRTLTINGVTQDLSANRTFTISTGITIGSTAIASGTVGRILFEGAGNVVQESSSLFWDNTNGRLGIGTSSPNVPLEVVGSNLLGIRTQISVNNAFDSIQVRNSSTGDTNQVRIKFDNENTVSASSGGVIFYTGNNYAFFPQNSFGFWNHTSNGVIALATNNTERFRIFSTGNVAINTTTDAGFKLDVNGTARVQGNTTISLNQNGQTLVNVSNTTAGTNSRVDYVLTSDANSGQLNFGKFSTNTTPYKSIASKDAFLFNNAVGGDIALHNEFATGRIKFAAGGSSTAQMTLFSTGNVGINTTTDAGFRLDVNGTARVTTQLSVGSDISVGSLGIDGYVYLNRASTGGNVGGIRAVASGSEIGGGTFVDRILCSNGSGLFFYTYTGSGSLSNQRMQIFANSGNVLIQNGGTFTDAGFRLDVNGTARVSGLITATGLVNPGSSVRLEEYVRSTSNSQIYFQTNGAIDLLGLTLTNAVFRSAQSVSIGTGTNALTSAQLEVASTTKGFLPPRMTTTQINAIASPAEGLMVYNTTISHMCVYQAGSWVKLSHSPM